MRFRQIRTYGADPADDDPNTTDPYGVTPTAGQVVAVTSFPFVFYFNDTDAAGLTCDWEVWVQDEAQTTRWVRVQASAAALSRRVMQAVEPSESALPLQFGSCQMFIRLTRTGAGGTLTGSEVLTTHVADVR